MEENWLPITEYAGKYKVSVSTLRRRIRNSAVAFRVYQGKYYILDQPDAMELPAAGIAASASAQTAEDDSMPHDVLSQPALTSMLMSELKSAYLEALQSKEAQIQQLKEEVADLQTLVKVLEDQNTKR